MIESKNKIGVHFLPKGIIVVLFFSLGCSTSSNLESSDKVINYRLHAGISTGGVVENTDMTVVENAAVDAFSGATKKGINLGGRVSVPLKWNYIETGIDYTLNSQKFTYNDLINNYVGSRNLNVSQFTIPVTYRIGLFRKKHPEGLFQIKIGYAAQLCFIGIDNESGTIPEATTSWFANGAIFGLSTTPFQIEGRGKIGFYVEGYRGTS